MKNYILKSFPTYKPYAMKETSITYRLRTLFLLLLLCSCLNTWAQQGLHIASLFEKYGEQKKVTMVELNAGMLHAYRMTLYKSMVFENVTPYLNDILQCLKQDAASSHVTKTQEIKESGQLISAYYCLTPVRNRKKTKNRYILFKRDRKNKAALVYIEGELNEKEMLKILYQNQE